MAGHIIGLGDRHSGNMLLDKTTAQVGGAGGVGWGGGRVEGSGIWGQALGRVVGSGMGSGMG